MYHRFHVLFTLLLFLLLLLQLTLSQEIIKRDDSDNDWDQTTTRSTAKTTTVSITTTSSESSSSNYISEYNDESTQPMNEDIYNSKDLFSTEPLVTDVNNVVQVKLYCEVDALYCKKVEKSLISAANAFAQVVKLKNKIVFQTSYYSFCKNQCSNSTLGWGTPSSQFTLISLNEADSNFIYPQALAKQLAQFTDSSNWANYDVAIDINHDIYMNNVNYDKIADTWNGTGIPPLGGFWFNEINETIQDHQVDLEYVILHQMMHGLGMVSSWAPYFSSTDSPFQKLLKNLITPEDSLKVMTPSPFWFVKHLTGPAYITGFQPNLIFDKFLNLLIPAKNETKWLGEYGFDMQSFCVQDSDAFIVNFMNAFLNNATQSSKAKSVYVSMSIPKTLSFKFNTLTEPNSAFFTNSYLNQTYSSIQLMTGPSILDNSAQTEESYFRPGIATSHVDEEYAQTPDFLMTHQFIRGKTLQTLVDEGYTNIPTIHYTTVSTIMVNVTRAHNVTNGNHTLLTNITTAEPREQLTSNVYRSAIGPGILRILETIGYSTVLTNTNYTTSAVKTNKPETTCDDTNNNNFNVRSDDLSNLPQSTSIAATAHSLHLYLYSFIVPVYCLLF